MRRRLPLTGIKDLLSVDLRALAGLRMALGFLAFLDTLLRLVDIRAHYTDFGVLPVGPYVEDFSNDLHVSLFLANGTVGWAAFLFGLTLVASLALLVGWRTRLATVATWVLVVSVQNRNPMVLNGGDVLLRLLLFWGMFLPLGARASVDRLLAPSAPKESLWFGGGTVGLVTQVVWVYLGTALLKTGPEWWPEGSASWYALSLDEFTTTFGLWVRQFTGFLRYSSYLVFFLEWSVAFLVFCPVRSAAVRTVMILLLAGMHLNFDLMMRLGLFPWVDIASLLVFVPPVVLDRLAVRAAPLTAAVAARAAALVQRLNLERRSLPGPPTALSNFLAIFFTGYIALWNLQGVPRLGITILEPWVKLGSILRVDQKWNMFAPFPMKEGGWYVIGGVLKDGTPVDVLAGTAGKASEARPELISALYPNARWRKFLMNLYEKRYREYRLYYGKWICRAWNEQAPPEKRLASFEITFMELLSPPPGETAQPKKMSLWTHDCFGK